MTTLGYTLAFIAAVASWMPALIRGPWEAKYAHLWLLGCWVLLLTSMAVFLVSG